MSTESRHEQLSELPVTVSHRLIMTEDWLRRKKALYVTAGLLNFILHRDDGGGAGSFFVCVTMEICFFCKTLQLLINFFFQTVAVIVF